jgi:hypothetical protein
MSHYDLQINQINPTSINVEDLGQTSEFNPPIDSSIFNNDLFITPVSKEHFGG